MSREKILSMIQAKGPVIPSQISKEVGTNILFASAMLSELVARKELRISHLKIGGSPLYYLPGQEQMLEGFTNKLQEKEMAAFLLLKEKKVLRDKEQTAVTRVALRSIKDFAIPLEVSFNSQKEVFWRFYSVGNAEAEGLIKGIFNLQEQKEKMTGQLAEPTQQPKQLKAGTEPINITQEAKAIKQRKKVVQESSLSTFFAKNNLTVKEAIEKRNSASEGFLEMESVLGTLHYYYLFKSKKTITEKDVNEALAVSQLKATPVVIFSSGLPNKKAAQLLGSLKFIHYKKIDAA